MPTLKDIIARDAEEPQGVERLRPNQQRVIEALFESRTICDAAERGGVDRRTIHRWLQTDAIFREEYRAVRREIMAQTTARLQAISKLAVDALERFFKDEEGRSAGHVSAIRTALDYAYRALELEEIETRLADVEEAIRNYASGSLRRV